MRFSNSLKLNHVFRRLYHTSGFADSYLVLYARRNRTGTNRVGITVSKKLGHAVVRNRTRRRLRSRSAAAPRSTPRRARGRAPNAPGSGRWRAPVSG